MPELGTWLTANATALKCHTHLRNTNDYPIQTSWVSEPCSPTKVMFIGQRTVHEGVTVMSVGGDWEMGYYDEGAIFQHSNSKVVWLVVSSAYRKPFYVFPEDVQEVLINNKPSA